MSRDSKCHCFPVTMRRTGAKAGRIWAGQIAHSCNAATKAALLEPPPLHAHAPNAPGGMQTATLPFPTHTLTRSTHARCMIDGKRHKGQQSAGLHLDRTRLLLHHLGFGDRADPYRSFPQSLVYPAQVSDCFKELPVSPALFNLHTVIHCHDLVCSRSPSSSMWKRAPMWLWMTHAFISFPFADQHSRHGDGISRWKATLRGTWYTEHIIQTCITHSQILLLGSCAVLETVAGQICS